VTAGFQDWILRLHPAIARTFGPSYATSHDAPAIQRGGASATLLALDATEKTSAWDVYVGMTPFDDMAGLIEAGAIEPWDGHVPPSVLADIDPAIRRECTLDGKLYAWPFLLDVTVQGWNAELVERADLDPGVPPASWDEYVAAARAVRRTGAAQYGCTFDARPWRSLVPIAYSFSTDVYTEEGLFDYTHAAVVEALEVLRRMFELANPDVLDPYTTVGAAATTDEAAFASQLAAYYVKYANAHVRAANTWPDPSRLALAPVPLAADAGATLFWTTGLALPRYGGNAQGGAEYAKALTYDDVLWRESIGVGRQGAGQLTAFRSLWLEWRADEPTWVPEWASRSFLQLRDAAPIRAHRLGTQQFTVARPYIDLYLTRTEKSARRALRDAMKAVRKAAG
jgi:ABC-type glycerol-3-phosphate transport system substrate-binding protein